MCSNLNKSNAECNGDYYAAFDSSPSGTPDCTPMSSSSTDSITQTSASTTNKNGSDQTTVSIVYNGVDAIDDCPNPTFTVTMICNIDITTPSTTTTVTKNGCNYQTSITAADACPVFTVNGLWVFLE